MVVAALLAGSIGVAVAADHYGLLQGGEPTGSLSKAVEAPVATTATSAAAPTESPTRTGAPARHHHRKAAAHTLPPMKVVPGRVLHHRTAAEIEAARQALLAERRAARAAQLASQGFSFTLGSFNVLGSQHSTPSGDHPRFPPASRRSAEAAGLIRAHGVDVLGTQELQPDQLNALQRYTGMAAYPGYAFGADNTDNSILYDPSVFEFVSGTSFPITFMHAVRPQTVLKLRERSTGREMYFVNMHASAGEGRYAVSRRNGHYAAVSEINRLKQEGLPVFLTGDMNDREEFYCRVVPPTGLVAAVGGNVSGGCHPAPHLAVDWVLGTPDTTFTHYWEDRSPVFRKISDHFFVSAVANVSPTG